MNGSPVRWLFNLLYGSTPVEWESAYALEQSIARLRGATLKSVFSALAEPAAVGTVSESKVKLQRVIPMIGNSFKPFFLGRFVQRDGRVFLTGRFTMLLIAKVFMSFWFGFLALVSFAGVASMLAAPSEAPGRFALVLGPLAMIALGIGMLRLAQWFTRNDAEWLTHLIQQAITAAPAHPELSMSDRKPSPVPGDGGRPMMLTIAAAVLGLMGVLNLSADIFGWYPSHGNSMSFIMDRVSPAQLRYAAALQGAFCLAMAAGVYRRALVAWRGVFLLMASAWVSSAAGIFLANDKLGPPPAIKIAFAVPALLIAVYWCRWWNAQRIHFIDGRDSGPAHSR